MTRDKIFVTLSADPALQTSVGDRIYPIYLPAQTQLPAITYQLERRDNTDPIDPFPYTYHVNARIHAADGDQGVIINAELTRVLEGMHLTFAEARMIDRPQLIGEVIFHTLSTNPLVQEMAGNRIYPHRLPQSAVLPSMTYQIISRTSESDNGHLYRHRLQFTVHAKTYADAHHLSHYAIRALEATEERFNRYHHFAMTCESLTEDYDSDLDEYIVYFDIFAFSATAE
jgi:hypothetical protein